MTGWLIAAEIVAILALWFCAVALRGAVYDAAWARANRDWESRYRRRHDRADQHAHTLGIGGAGFLHGDADKP